MTDNRDASRFEVEEDGHLARLEYRLDGTRLVLVHTEVPKQLGGRGIGGRLVQEAVARAEAEGLVVVPRCPFARSWLERHPAEAARVEVEWPPGP